jgi:hypothetical protein
MKALPAPRVCPSCTDRRIKAYGVVYSEATQTGEACVWQCFGCGALLEPGSLPAPKRVRTLFTLVRSEADSRDRGHSADVKAFVLKRWKLAFCLCPPWWLFKRVHPA